MIPIKRSFVNLNKPQVYKINGRTGEVVAPDNDALVTEAKPRSKLLQDYLNGNMLTRWENERKINNSLVGTKDPVEVTEAEKSTPEEAETIEAEQHVTPNHVTLGNFENSAEVDSPVNSDEFPRCENEGEVAMDAKNSEFPGLKNHVKNMEVQQDETISEFVLEHFKIIKIKY